MKKAIFFAILLPMLSLVSCKDRQKQGEAFLPESKGNINEIAIVIDDVMWNGEVGDSLRKKLAYPVDGLPQEEPIFTINQYSPKIFEGVVTQSRNILVVSKGLNKEFKHVENKYAKPQNVFYITGYSIHEILDLIETHSETLISIIKYSEIHYVQHKMEKARLSDDKLRGVFMINIEIPDTYRYADEKEYFYWMKKDIPSGSSSLLVYQVPISQIEKNNDIVGNIVKVRDSVGALYIRGTMEHSSMVTEEGYSPYFMNTRLDGKTAYETKGTWELQNNFMSGPFLNYAIRDEKNKRYLILEGFVYDPSNAKRDMIFELEAIMKSVHILQ
ncbi:DUF4837 family protein [Flavobacterium sp. WV_118_3]|uniref:DUF4837 family protein n=1 Tax=Flavobacterium sp. WV_118_3 TaxID=3151764 RepID=UPI00321C0346